MVMLSERWYRRRVVLSVGQALLSVRALKGDEK